MRKLNIGIDIDGTVTEANDWLLEANRYFKKSIQPKDVTRYEIEKVMGVTKEEYDEFYALCGEKIHTDTKMRFGVQEVLKSLSKNHGLHFITAREEKMRDVSVGWLRQNKIPMDTITLLGHANKAGQAKELECSLFVEDSYNNAMHLAKAGIDVLLIDCSYNKGHLPKNVTRVHNWFEIRQIIKNISFMPEYQLAAN